MFFILSKIDFVGANVGLAITQAINLIGMCNWGLRQTAELENQMTSVERVDEYANTTSERPLETDQSILEKMVKPWPHKGIIKFNNLSLKYSDTSDYILRNLNFTVHERVRYAIYFIEIIFAHTQSYLYKKFALNSFSCTFIFFATRRKSLA